MRQRLEGVLIGVFACLAMWVVWKDPTAGWNRVVHAQASRGSGYTQTFSVGSSTYVAVTAITSCRNVTVGEDRSAAGFPTADFYVAKPTSNNTPRRVVSAGTYSFMSQSMFQPGDIVGYIKLVSGSSTFFQDESPT